MLKKHPKLKSQLLESYWRDEDYIPYYRYFDPKTKQSYISKNPFDDIFAIPSDNKNSPYKTLVGNVPLKLVSRFPGKNKEYYKLSSDIQLAYNFTMGRGKYNHNPRIWYLDIETTAHDKIDVQKAKEEIVLIQIYDSISNKMIVIGDEEFNTKKYEKGYKKDGFELKYIRVKNEREILSVYFKILQKLKPLLVFAWNGMGFDYPYLVKRALKHGFDLNEFSPFRMKTTFKELYNEKKGEIYYRFNAAGIHYLDYMDIFKKFTYEEKRSYSLEYIANIILGFGKVKHAMYSTFDAFRTGDPESYIMPSEPPKDKYEYEMYLLQKEYRKNPSEYLRRKIKVKANELFVHYGIVDTFILKKLDDILRFRDILFKIASDTGSTYSDVLGTVRIWANLIEIFCMDQGKFLPPDTFDNDTEFTKFVGGFVSDPLKGLFNWVLSVDINSAYPNLSMRGFNISPETYIPREKYPKELEKILVDLGFFNENDEDRFNRYINEPEKFKKLGKLLKKYNVSLGMDGSLYTKDFKGVVPILVGEFYRERKKVKSEMISLEKVIEDKKHNGEEYHDLEIQASVLNSFQMAIKILINSLFGALTNKYFRMFNVDLGKSITGNTRFYIRLLRKNLNDYLSRILKEPKGNYLIYGDTDSVYFTLEKIANRIKQKHPEYDRYKIAEKLSEFTEKYLQPVVDKTNEEFAEIFNAYDSSVIKAERETIADKGLFLQKKKYLLRALDVEGVVYDPPKIKKTGIDLVRSSTPPFMEAKLKESVEYILDMTNDDLREYIQNVKKELKKAPLEDICKFTGIGSLNYDLYKPKYDSEGRKIAIPINSRAALITNEYIEKNNLSGLYFPITTQDKVQIAFLKSPNPLKSNIFAFKDGEFAEKFREYIDYDTIFDKYFLKPLELMLEPMGWDVRKKVKNLFEDDW